MAKNGKNLASVTYHDPCHARKMQGVFKEPRKLLAQNYEMTEMEDPNECCGFGGVTMQSEKYHLSRAAGQRKSEMIKNSGAKIVSAECSACKMQISNALHIGGSEVKCENPIELIARVLG